MVSGKGRRERNTQGMHKENVSQSHWFRKQKGLNFMSSCKQCDLKPIILKLNGFGCDTALRAFATPGEKADKQPRDKTA